MRLTAKLTAILTLVMCVILTGHGYLSIERQKDLFRDDTVHDGALLARTIAAAVQRMSTSLSEEEIQAFVREINTSESDLEVHWRSIKDLKKQGIERVDGQIQPMGLESNPNAPVRSYVPVRMGNVEGAVEIVESQGARDRYVSRTLERLGVVLLTMVLLGAILSFGLGAWLVGRPITQLIEKARTVGAGANTPLDMRRCDELGELAKEMDLMSHQVTEAQEEASRREEERRKTEKALRHAERLVTAGKLASGVAHEIGTPLNVISGHAEMIVKGELSHDEIMPTAGIIRDQAKRIAGIVRQMLDFVRRPSPKRKEVELNNVVRQTLALLMPMAKKKNVELKHEESEESQLAHLDQNQIQQVLTNLTINGVHAMPEGGELRVRVFRTDESPPGEHSTDLGAYLCLQVQDSGVGISEEDLTHIFDPFFTTKDVGEGTGLGLAVVHGIVREHRGWIDVNTKVGEGTTFSVFLPMRAS